MPEDKYAKYRDKFEALFKQDISYLGLNEEELIKVIQGKEQEIKNPEKTKEKIQVVQNIPEIEKLKQFYSTLGINDFSSWNNLKLPNKRRGFERLIIVHKGLTTEQSFQKCKGRFNSWKYTNDSLDSVITQNDRTNKDRTYAIWVRPCIEADEIHKNKSANILKQQNIKSITLNERLILELIYHHETKEHLDISNVTLCEGSRDARGYVPRVGWGGSVLGVHWYSLDGQVGGLRSREIVSD